MGSEQKIAIEDWKVGYADGITAHWMELVWPWKGNSRIRHTDWSWDAHANFHLPMHIPRHGEEEPCTIQYPLMVGANHEGGAVAHRGPRGPPAPSFKSDFEGSLPGPLCFVEAGSPDGGLPDSYEPEAGDLDWVGASTSVALPPMLEGIGGMVDRR